MPPLLPRGATTSGDGSDAACLWRLGGALLEAAALLLACRGTTGVGGPVLWDSTWAVTLVRSFML